ncbi:MAG: DUF4012 domain-containing protein [Parcubacteria group bacterium]|nr:DUF4012 domain-containing protein [Parcubacteria group bacterium]
MEEKENKKNQRFYSDIKPVLVIKKKQNIFDDQKNKELQNSNVDLSKEDRVLSNKGYFDLRPQKKEEETNKEAKKNSTVLHTPRKSFNVLKNLPNTVKSGVKNFNFNQVVNSAILFKNKLFLKKSFTFFVILCFFFVFSIKGFAYFNDNLSKTKGRIVDDTNVAYQYLMSGQGSIMEKDFDLASYKFNVAAERFESAESELGRTGEAIAHLLKEVPGGSSIYSGKKLLEAGASVSYASKCLAQAFEPFGKTEDIFAEFKGGDTEETSTYDQISFTLALASSYENILLAQKNIKQASKNLEDVKAEDFPEEYRSQVITLKSSIPKLEKGLEYFSSHVDLLLKLLGHNQSRKYLLLFQNNRELRATGGFVGTYGLFNMDEGKINDLKIEGPYNIDGQLIDKIKAPEAMRLIQTRLYMRDANWFLDFPTSAEKTMIMHEKAGGPTVDGVVTFTASVFEDLLKVTGPIEMPEYNVTVTSENFFNEAQREVEVDYDKELNKPKKFIADLFPKFFEKIANVEKDQWPEVMNAFMGSLYKKDILVYFSDEELESLIQDFGWGGEVKETDNDYLSLGVSNIGGGKTDHITDQKIDYYSEIQPNGSVVNTVKIKRKHNGNKNDFWTSIKNVSYLRVYVPRGSVLIDSFGFDNQFYDVLMPEDGNAYDDPLIKEIEGSAVIHEPSATRITIESGKTVFGNFSGLEVGEEKEIVLKYKLPFKVNLRSNYVEKHSLLVQKQPGTSNPVKFNGKIVFPSEYESIWQYPENLNIEQNMFKIEEEINTDKVYGFVLGKKE